MLFSSTIPHTALPLAKTEMVTEKRPARVLKKDSQVGLRTQTLCNRGSSASPGSPFHAVCPYCQQVCPSTVSSPFPMLLKPLPGLSQHWTLMISSISSGHGLNTNLTFLSVGPCLFSRLNKTQFFHPLSMGRLLSDSSSCCCPPPPFPGLAQKTSMKLLCPGQSLLSKSFPTQKMLFSFDRKISFTVMICR